MISKYAIAGAALLLAFYSIASMKYPAGNSELVSTNTAAASAASCAFSVDEMNTGAIFGGVFPDSEEPFSLQAPGNAVVHEEWRLRGASQDGFWLDLPWTFPFGESGHDRVFVSSFGALSFGAPKTRINGVELPDETGRDFIAVLQSVMGIVPERNWHLLRNGFEESVFWRSVTPGGNVLFTWQNALLGRTNAAPISIQAELDSFGDFTMRYDFSAVPDLAARLAQTGFSAGAQVGGFAMSCKDDVGDTVASGSRFAVKWYNLRTLGGAEDDFDSDGLTNFDEIKNHRTIPRNPDSENNGWPDGEDETAWLAHPAWAGAGNPANLIITLTQAIPGHATALLIVPDAQNGDLRIPLSAQKSYALNVNLNAGFFMPVSNPHGADVKIDVSVVNTPGGFVIHNPYGAGATTHSGGTLKISGGDAIGKLTAVASKSGGDSGGKDGGGGDGIHIHPDGGTPTFAIADTFYGRNCQQTCQCTCSHIIYRTYHITVPNGCPICKASVIWTSEDGDAYWQDPETPALAFASDSALTATGVLTFQAPDSSNSASVFSDTITRAICHCPDSPCGCEECRHWVELHNPDIFLVDGVKTLRFGNITATTQTLTETHGNCTPAPIICEIYPDTGLNVLSDDNSFLTFCTSNSVPGIYTITAIDENDCATDVVRIEIYEVKFDPTKRIFYSEASHTWPMHADAKTNFHRLACSAKLYPPNPEIPITYTLLPDTLGAEINPETGEFTPAHRTGDITVRATAVGVSDCFDDTTVNIHAVPVAVTNSVIDTKSWNLFAYGRGRFHTFESSGGSLAGVEISETVEQTQNPFNNMKHSVKLEEFIWSLNGNGSMTKSDAYFLNIALIDTSKFMPDNFPQTQIMEQCYYWRCGYCNPKIWVQFSGPSPITFTLDKDSSGELKMVSTAYGLSYTNSIGTGF